MNVFKSATLTTLLINSLAHAYPFVETQDASDINKYAVSTSATIFKVSDERISEKLPLAHKVEKERIVEAIPVKKQTINEFTEEQFIKGCDLLQDKFNYLLPSLPLKEFANAFEGYAKKAMNDEGIDMTNKNTLPKLESYSLNNSANTLSALRNNYIINLMKMDNCLKNLQTTLRNIEEEDNDMQEELNFIEEKYREKLKANTLNTLMRQFMEEDLVSKQQEINNNMTAALQSLIKIYTENLKVSFFIGLKRKASRDERLFTREQKKDHFGIDTYELDKLLNWKDIVSFTRILSRAEHPLHIFARAGYAVAPYQAAGVKK